MVKDYTKSEKHYWDETMFIPDVADTLAARRVAARFRELREASFDSGFVIRRYEEYEPGEARTWWVDGECVLVTAHPDTPDIVPRDLDVTFVRDAVATLRSPFVTVDLARRAETEVWRVIEVGDGQVSDRPVSTDAAAFVATITGAA